LDFCKQSVISVVLESMVFTSPPSSGQLYIFHSLPGDTRTNNWKKDMLQYTMRKNQNAFQENR